MIFFYAWKMFLEWLFEIRNFKSQKWLSIFFWNFLFQIVNIYERWSFKLTDAWELPIGKIQCSIQKTKFTNFKRLIQEIFIFDNHDLLYIEDTYSLFWTCTNALAASWRVTHLFRPGKMRETRIKLRTTNRCLQYVFSSLRNENCFFLEISA